MKLLVSTAHVLQLNNSQFATHSVSSQQNPQVHSLKQQQDVCPQHTGVLFASTQILAYPVPTPACLQLGRRPISAKQTVTAESAPAAPHHSCQNGAWQHQQPFYSHHTRAEPWPSCAPSLPGQVAGWFSSGSNTKTPRHSKKKS